MSSTLVEHTACPCGTSSDAFARYDDGHGHCFRCEKTFQAWELDDDPEFGARPRAHRSVRRAVAPDVAGLISGAIEALPKWGLGVEVCRKFGYQVGEYNGQRCHIAPYHTPDGELIAQKVRLPGKDFLVLGDIKRAGLFGQRLWGGGGRRIVITEGEKDCLAVAQTLHTKNWWPVVSVKNGAGGARRDIQQQLEWLEKWDEIVLCFDMDEPGRKAAQQCAELFTPGKVRMVAFG